jgi:hypothetical protein
MRTRIKQNERRAGGRLNAVLLILSFVLPFAQFAFVPEVDAASLLPACCRMRGKHHCPPQMTDGGEQGSSDTARSQSVRGGSVSERCPYTPGVSPVAHGSSLWAPTRGFVEVRIHDEFLAAVTAEAGYAIALPRANPKRGPPNSSVAA